MYNLSINAKEPLLLVRAVNFQVAVQDFTIVIITTLQHLGTELTTDDSIQLGVTNFYNKKTGKFNQLT